MDNLCSSRHQSLHRLQVINMSVLKTSLFGLVVLAALVSAQHHDWHEHHEHHEHHEPKHIKFEYGVHDAHTGDIKSHHETRDGHNVKGYYKVKEADGRTREVIYAASKHGGFNAIVKHTGHAHHIELPKHETHHEIHLPKHEEHKEEISFESPTFGIYDEPAKHVFAVSHKHGVSNQYVLFGHHYDHKHKY